MLIPWFGPKKKVLGNFLRKYDENIIFVAEKLDIAKSKIFIIH